MRVRAGLAAMLVGAASLGAGALSAHAVAPVTPGAPRNVSVRGIDDALVFSWSAPTSVGSAGIIGYSIREIAPDHDPQLAWGVSGETRSWTLGALQNFQRYTFRITAYNRFGEGPAVVVTGTPKPSGYVILDRGGNVFGYGELGVPWLFSESKTPYAAIELSSDGAHYWKVTRTGHVDVFNLPRDLDPIASYGDVPPANLTNGETVVSLLRTPSDRGYWIITSHGRVFTFGDAHAYGDLGGVRLSRTIVGAAATPTRKGYYLVASDGGVFAFGDATFHGSMAATRLNRPVVGVVSDPDGAGYWLVASDGGVFAFDAPFRGSMGGVRLSQAIAAMTSFGNGYLMLASDGGIFDFSNKAFFGSLSGNHLTPDPKIAITACC